MSEQRIVNPVTGGEKCTKPQRMELLPLEQLLEVSELYAAGAKKYDDNNWRKGYAWSLSHGALLRHISLWWEGEENDEETQCSHLSSVVFHALALMYFKRHHLELDDRPPTTASAEWIDGVVEEFDEPWLIGGGVD